MKEHREIASDCGTGNGNFAGPPSCLMRKRHVRCIKRYFRNSIFK